jgi:upstream activation factor subunit UAF30
MAAKKSAKKAKAKPAKRSASKTAKRPAARKTATKARKAAPKKAAKKTAAKKTTARKAAPKKAAKKAAPKKKRAPNPAFMKPMTPSGQLAAVVGDKAIPRSEVTKKVWAYIKNKGLQDNKNRRMINADDKLGPVFGGKKQVSMFEMTKLVNKHLKG